MTKEQLKRLEAIGSRWQKEDMDRLYVNDLATVYGLTLTWYRTGNVSSALLDGQSISNTTARDLLDDLGDLKVWYDYTTDRLESKITRRLRRVDVSRLLDRLTEFAEREAEREA